MPRRELPKGLSSSILPSTPVLERMMTKPNVKTSTNDIFIVDKLLQSKKFTISILSLSRMKISFVLVLIFGLIMIFSNTSVEGEYIKNPLSFSLHGDKGKENMVHQDKSFFSSSVGGKSNEETKMDINNLGEMKGKDIENPSLATNKAKSKNHDKDKYNKCDGDPIAQTLGMSMDTHHVISINDYQTKYPTVRYETITCCNSRGDQRMIHGGGDDGRIRRRSFKQLWELLWAAIEG
ncbi:hypothetical protein C4D60_Mb08t12510 [Musa balbisiana]|uniref:Uncharacterized protein n=1 Tax=Musa balbisiana TaxID=52838 RepID=A0A4S8K3E1_MUSBA|nr:hypothetical protein C4D60_Mb08t12510 [Musa balbisiana]